MILDGEGKREGVLVEWGKDVTKLLRLVVSCFGRLGIDIISVLPLSIYRSIQYRHESASHHLIYPYMAFSTKS